MEDLALMESRHPKMTWTGRKVLITGHTGFIGGWLAHTLIYLGAKVYGYSDRVPTSPSLFETTGLATVLNDCRGDISELDVLSSCIANAEPDIVIHLAAQPLVGLASRDPVTTFQSNLLGTVVLLEAMRRTTGIKTALVMTTDKVYQNREWIWSYRENDPLGGHEPYGVSKAMAEMAINMFRDMYGHEAKGNDRRPRLVAIRAGNVIGGGDWSEDRLVPDAIRAWSTGQPLRIRSPAATRPWQHVMEVVNALVKIAEHTWVGKTDLKFAYNVGPDDAASVSVSEVAQLLAQRWGTGAEINIGDAKPARPESQRLAVDATLLRTDLGWKPRLSLPEAIRWTVDWYKSFLSTPHAARTTTQQQISEFFDGRT